jgi:glutamine amidotransferase
VIVIVDYGMGNLRSVQKGLEKVGSTAHISCDPADVLAADKLILPGVGAFGDAMKHLGERGLIEPLQTFARSGRPFLGICLGLQLLFDVSTEGGRFDGLGIVPGRVIHFGEDDRDTDSFAARGLKVPHMGWNQLRWTSPCPLLAGLESGTHFYFVHSYHVVPADDSVSVGRCDYGNTFTAMIQRGNLFATQFHPEKSQTAGLTILRNFASL